MLRLQQGRGTEARRVADTDVVYRDAGPGIERQFNVATEHQLTPGVFKELRRNPVFVRVRIEGHHVGDQANEHDKQQGNESTEGNQEFFHEGCPVEDSVWHMGLTI